MPDISFSVATFNVRNLVNAQVDYYCKPDGTGCKSYCEGAFDRKLDWLAGQLIEIDADIVLLQEVFHAEALSALAERYAVQVQRRGLKQSPYDVVHHIPNARANADRGPQPGLGLLSRLAVPEITAIQDISADPITLGEDYGVDYSLKMLSRPIMRAKVDLGLGVSTWIFNAHLKSKRPALPIGHPADEDENFLFLDRAKGAIGSLVLRAGEALALRRAILEVAKNKSGPVIVLGDLNDEGSAVTSEVIKGEAPWRHADFAVKKGFWDVELYSAARTHLRKSETANFTTHVYNGHHGALDHIFFSQEFYYRNKSRLGDLDYVRCFNDHLTDDGFFDAPYHSDASDHGQLMAYFTLSEERVAQQEG
ncbi:MAG: endonuclease/exonuclease/phosphatase family protein [Marinovum sp.]|nr:endonuclease/exonuclease/phosphatase family protein [Marinovum sp.]